VGNWFEIMSRQKKLTFFTASFDQFSIVFPYIVVSPAYFDGQVQLGALMQTASAFGSVQSAMSFFVSTYSELAEWGAVIQRLIGFNAAIDQARATATASPGIKHVPGDSKGGIQLHDVSLRLPNGAPMVADVQTAFGAGRNTLLTGPSGSGKSTLFRAIAGVWPFGRGTIAIPKDAHVMILPQRPYFPVGTLAAAIAYPAEPGTFSEATLARTLDTVGLPALAKRLGEEAHWNRMLSLGEQQRLAIARAILQKPDFLFLDEATASLDESSEAALYGVLRAQLAGTTVISIGHRSTLTAFHDRKIALQRDGEQHRLIEAKAEPAAS
jgi:putative ATP-binding cassette transporter